MNKVIAIMGPKYCLFRKDGECVVFDRKSRRILPRNDINQEQAEQVLSSATDQQIKSFIKEQC